MEEWQRVVQSYKGAGIRMASAFTHAVMGLSIGSCFYRRGVSQSVWVWGWSVLHFPTLMQSVSLWRSLWFFLGTSWVYALFVFRSACRGGSCAAALPARQMRPFEEGLIYVPVFGYCESWRAGCYDEWRAWCCPFFSV